MSKIRDILEIPCQQLYKCVVQGYLHRRTFIVKLLSLFSGIGAFEKALDKLGCNYELVNYCEVDKYASKAYSLIHNVSEDMNLWDVTSVDTSKLPKDIDLVTYGFPCVPKGYLVRTTSGFKPIEMVEEGERVLTHKNRFRKVLRTMNRVSDHILHIKGVGAADLQLTDEHPIYTYSNEDFTWKKAKDLEEGDYLVYNINTKSVPLNYSDDDLWLMGRYVADGYREKCCKHRVIYTIGNTKKEEFESHLGNRVVGKDYVVRQKKGCLEYKMKDAFLEEHLTPFSTYSTKKVIPAWILDLPKEQLSCFLDGYLKGDGHHRKDRDIQMFSTVNRNMGVSLQEIIIKLYNVVPTVSIRKDNRKATYHDTYNYQYSLSPIGQKIIDNKILVKIKSITREELPIEVFNLEVDEDNSYCVENVIVHNCQDISVAGLQRGFENEDGSRTRSGLFYEALRIINDCRPKVAIAENVKNLVCKKFKKEFDIVLKSLEDAGYNNYWQVLNAKDFGIPQNRERVFIVSVRKDIDYKGYKFPDKIPLELRLRDVLEDVVDEKYYLSDELLKKVNTSNVQKTLGNVVLKNNPEILLENQEQTYHSSDTTLVSDSVPLKRGYSIEIKEEQEDTTNVDVIGNYSKSNYQATVVVGKNGVAPTVRENHGQVTGIVETDCIIKCGNTTPKDKSQCDDVVSIDGIYPTTSAGCHGNGNASILEPFIVASRGRNPDNPSDRTTGNYVEQTLEPNEKGVCNTLTSVAKDNYVCEPRVEQVGTLQGGVWDKIYESCRRVYSSEGLSPTINTQQGGGTEIKVLEPKLVGGIGEKKSNNGTQYYQGYRIYSSDTVSCCLSTDQKDWYEVSNNVEMQNTEENQSFISKHLNNFIDNNGYIPHLFNAYNEKEIGDIAPTLTTNCGCPGSKTRILRFIQYRIRKLTPKECFRLMGFDDEDFSKVDGIISNSRLYKCAGNSIVVNVLYYLLKDVISIIDDSNNTDVQQRVRKPRRFVF